MQGQSFDDIKGADSELQMRHKVMPGNRPSNTLLLDRVDAHHTGALIALYEHKVFCQAVIWGINPFDQWGVELGKALGDQILKALSGGDAQLDGSTRALLSRYSDRKNR
jgi:glucose-6-phosphate isomerase